MSTVSPSPDAVQDLAIRREPYLSIVACSRNDGHGENLIERMQLFVDGIADQAERFRLDCELVLVDWNPPQGKPGLADVLRYPDASGYLTSRVVVVPPEVHTELPHAEALPLFQMIAKNVGIRRARGRMVLSTNIDILFPDALMALIARRDLDENALYRTDRADIKVPFGAPGATDPRAMRRLRPMRVNRRDGTYDSNDHRVVPSYTGLADFIAYVLEQSIRRDLPRQVKPANPTTERRGPVSRSLDAGRKLWRLVTLPKPHLNACGDFTLMSRDNWHCLHGHAEWAMYSWNLDALLLYQARALCITEVDLRPEFTVLHMDHSKGSGWTPEGAGDLFTRMEKLGVPVFTNEMLAREAGRLGVTRFRKPHALRYSDDSWGWSNVALDDRIVTVAPLD